MDGLCASFAYVEAGGFSDLRISSACYVGFLFSALYAANWHPLGSVRFITNRKSQFQNPKSLVSRIRIRHVMQFDIFHSLNEPIETLVRIAQEFVPWNDKLPFRVPDGTPNQPIVRELR